MTPPNKNQRDKSKSAPKTVAKAMAKPAVKTAIKAAPAKGGNGKVDLKAAKVEKSAAAKVARPAVATPPVKSVAVKAPKEPSAKRNRSCTEPGCTLLAVGDEYCRLHYIKNWATIINGRRAQARVNLNKYIESLSEKFPEGYMDKIRDDLGNEGAFHARLRELGFREEYESGSDNPFQMDNVDNIFQGLKFDE